MEPAGSRPSRTTLALLAVVVLCCLCFAYRLRFVQDDAFISFRYSESLAHGNGLVWNIGERVCGYTNFLWTVLMAIPQSMHYSVVSFSYFVGLTCFSLTLLMTFGIARRILPDGWATAAVALTGLNYSFAIYGTGGLETPLHALLLTAALYFAAPLVEGEVSQLALLCLSLTSGLAMLTRLDSAPYLAVIQLFVVLQLLRCPARGNAWLALLAPETILFSAWCAWQISFYGHLLPNTFYLKIGSESAAVRYTNGLLFVSQFLVKYLFLPALLLLLFHVKKLWHRPVLGVIACVAAAWCLYVIYAGGDFMEYRFMVVSVPLFAVLLMWAARESNRWHLGTGFVVLGFAAALAPAIPFNFAPESMHVHTRKQLVEQLSGERTDLEGVGKLLGSVFRGDPTVRIAVGPAGAIPFYSGLPSVDMWGPNDAWVARYGKPGTDYPGHYRLATVPYLLQRETTLIIGMVKIVPRGAPLHDHYTAAEVIYAPICGGHCLLPEGAKVLRAPLDDHRDLEMVYVFPHPAVDRAIAKNHWQVRPIVD